MTGPPVGERHDAFDDDEKTHTLATAKLMGTYERRR
jgi:hypothetical protein